MTVYLTIYEFDGGRALPKGFQAELSEESEVAEVEARLALLGLAMESLGLEVSFTTEPPPGRTAPELGFHVIR